MTKPSQDTTTILQALAHHCKARPDYEVLTWVDGSCKETNKMTYKALDKASNAVAAHLLKLGCKKGDRVMIAYPFGLEFLAGLFGCMKIGVIGCSIYPPNPKKIGSEIQKFNGFVEDAGAKIALSTNAFAVAMRAFGMVYSSKVKWIGTDGLAKPSNSKLKQIQQLANEATADDVAFIQYTSGSTGMPKGVMIPHLALVENTRAFSEQCGVVAGKTVGALWLPQYHDMGLIGGFMTSVYSAFHLVMASPIDFITKPLLWTDMVERYKADLTGAPNFAYALLLKRLQQTGRTADWSHVTRAFFGAEPTQTKVVEGVIETLGMKPEHVFNNYGMAESVVFLTGGVAKTAEDGLVSCGKAKSNTLQLRIVDQGQVVPDGDVGTIWAQSPRVAGGYYGKEEVTKATFKNTLPGENGFWLDTGDLGKVVDGQLFVTGRVKDVIIVNGKNYYPTDIELSVEHEFKDKIRPGRSAAFQMADDTVGVLVEARDGKKVKGSEVDVSIAKHVLQEHGLVTERVLVMSPGAAPKTTSGKLKRSQIRSTTMEDTWDDKLVLLSHSGVGLPSPAKRRSSTVLERQFSCRGINNEDKFLSHEMQNEISKSMALMSHCSMRSLPAFPESQEHDDLAVVIKEVTGNIPDMNRTWEDNGLASIKAAELVAKIQEKFHVDIPSNFADMYPTPQDLQELLFKSSGTAFETVAHEDSEAEPTLSPRILALLQGVSMVAMVFLLALSLLPSFFIGNEISNLSMTFEIGSSGRFATWSYLPIAVPIFFVTFTILVISLKWLVVGSYKVTAFQLHSWQYLQWWFMDRMLDMWEAFVGQFLLETKLLWLIYRLMGANISPSVNVHAFIREFDLVQIGPGSKLEHQLRCRKFRLWDKSQESPVIVFRSVSIGDTTIVSGMLSPGCQVGNGCIVENRAAVSEGSIVPDEVIARGNPAFNAGKVEATAGPATPWGWQLNFLKLAWLVIELYLFFGLFLSAQVVMNEQLPSTWRYTPLHYWFLVLLLTATFGLVVSIFLKWVLIGKRAASNDSKDTLWSDASNWVCDFHFRLCLLTLLPLSGASFIWIVVLKLHGLDIDFSTVINGVHCFKPSNVDLIKIRNSFISVPSFDIDASKGMIEIIDSSLGYNSLFYSGVQIIRSSIPPKSVVKESVFDSNQKFFRDTGIQKVALTLTREVAQLILNFFILCAFVPSYEVFTNTVYDSAPIVAILGVVSTLLVHALSFHLLLRLVELVTSNSPSFLQRAMFGVYVYHAWINKVWNFWYLLHGTRMFSVWLQVMGSEVKGSIWYFGSELYDLQKLHFVGERMIVDDSHLAGHFVVPDMLVINDTYIHGGLVQPGSYAYAGASIADQEHEAFQVFHGNTQSSKAATLEVHDEEALVKNETEISLSKQENVDASVSSSV